MNKLEKEVEREYRSPTKEAIKAVLIPGYTYKILTKDFDARLKTNIGMRILYGELEALKILVYANLAIALYDKLS